MFQYLVQTTGLILALFSAPDSRQSYGRSDVLKISGADIPVSVVCLDWNQPLGITFGPLHLKSACWILSFRLLAVCGVAPRTREAEPVPVKCCQSESERTARCTEKHVIQNKQSQNSHRATGKSSGHWKCRTNAWICSDSDISMRKELMPDPVAHPVHNHTVSSPF